MTGLKSRIRWSAAISIAAALAGCGGLPPDTLPSSHVLLHASLSHEEAAPILREAERTVQNVSDFLERAPPDAPVEVFLFSSRWGLWRFLRRHCPDQASSAAVCFEEGDSCVVALSAQWRSAETLRLLRHELAHAVIETNFSEVPPWAHEGLAQYFEPGAPYGGAPPDLLKSVLRCIRRGPAGALARLVAIPWGRPLGREEYAQAWSFTHFIITQVPGGPALLRAYLKRVRAGPGLEEQFREVFGQRPSELESAWGAYILALAMRP